MLVLAEHPLDDEVVVMVYVPGEVNVFVFHPVLLPPDQENVLPPFPVSDIVVVLQVNSVVPVLLVIVAVGGVVFVPLVILELAVQTLGFVTVTV